jgi:plasmid maintenance system killer protein
MEISFSTKKLKKQMELTKEMVKVHGPLRAKKLRLILTALRAAPSLAAFAPPYSPPHRCHELTGNLKGKLSLDLDHPYRLLFVPDHEPLPRREEGGLDWSKVTAVTITGVENTHG